MFNIFSIIGAFLLKKDVEVKKELFCKEHTWGCAYQIAPNTTQRVCSVCDVMLVVRTEGVRKYVQFLTVTGTVVTAFPYDPSCRDCCGTGTLVTPAHQQAGHVVDEREDPCHCTKKEEEHYDNE